MKKVNDGFGDLTPGLMGLQDTPNILWKYVSHLWLLSSQRQE